MKKIRRLLRRDGLFFLRAAAADQLCRKNDHLRKNGGSPGPWTGKLW